MIIQGSEMNITNKCALIPFPVGASYLTHEMNDAHSITIYVFLIELLVHKRYYCDQTVQQEEETNL
jgi:hypothetical protein